MEGEAKKSIKYLMNQPATVHNYGKLRKSESPRTHSSPTSILRKFPHSLRHDQKHQTKIKRNSSPVNVIISGISVSRDQWKTNRKSWSFGDDGSDESEGRSSSDDCGKGQEDCECKDSRAKRKFSETSISSDCSNGNETRKLHPTPVNTNKHNSVQELNKKCAMSDSTGNGKVADRTGEILGSTNKLSVINNCLNECKNVKEGIYGGSVNKVSEFRKSVQSRVHKSTPNLLRSSLHSENVTDPLNGEVDSFDGKRKFRYHPSRKGGNGPLKGSDSLPHLGQTHRIIHSILPKISRTISESPENASSKRKSNLAKACIKSESHINSHNLYKSAMRRGEPYFSLSNLLDGGVKSDVNRSDDENEGLNLIEKQKSAIIRSGKGQKELKNRWSCRKTPDMMPNFRILMNGRSKGDSNSDDAAPPGASAPLMTPLSPRSESYSSLNIPQIRYYDEMEEDLSVKKCDTVYALTSLIRADSTFHVEPLKPVNRLRVPPHHGFSGSTSRMCSRCSSFLSMASSSRYSINTTGSGFVSCSPSEEKLPEPGILCKLCLVEVPISMSLKINCCGCVFCKDCMRLYVEFEIQEGAYDISCPDAQCCNQGIVSIDEVETLVMPRMMERYRRFRLNHEVDMDRNRTWCPRAGCETVCDICPREKCAPTSVHCPTCDSDFCSNCKNPWHKGLTCEENSKKLAKEGRTDFMEPGIPFDSDFIKCCPMCNVPIEKDEGCAQMMCKRCKHVFCWYCLASLDDDFLLRHYDKGPCKNKLGHTRASVIWHRTQVIGIFAGLGLLLLVASPLLLLAAPCIVCCKCRVCSGTKLDGEDDLPEESAT